MSRRLHYYFLHLLVRVMFLPCNFQNKIYLTFIDVNAIIISYSNKLKHYCHLTQLAEHSKITTFVDFYERIHKIV